MKMCKVLLAALAVSMLTGCQPYGVSTAGRFVRDTDMIDYGSVEFTPWDTAAASENIPPQEAGDFTLLIYMNGSDLESENAAATDDINEMLRSGVDSRRINVIIFTGGTNRWQNDVISENECAVWRVGSYGIEKITGVGLLNMGDAGTLSGFISFGLKNYPAQGYGLVMWDHGGGSIAGYGQDEKFNNSSLSLLEMDYAFNKAGLDGRRLEFIGFDACLMSTVEVAVVASRYAKYLIASEDIEPADGWDYACLSALNEVPTPDGGSFGMAVTDTFYNYYGDYSSESVTMAVTDLANANGVMGAMDALMERCSSQLASGTNASFYALAKRRGLTKSFGNGSPRDNDCDMVDVGDMARKLGSMFPREAEAVRNALKTAVIYSRHNSTAELSGLSAYYIYGGGEYAGYSLQTYAELGMSGAYTEYLRGFAELLTDGNIEVLPDSISVRLQGLSIEPLRAYEAYRSVSGAGYAIPAEVNGIDADIIVFCTGGGDITLLGVRHEDGFIVQKGVDKLKIGDTMSFYKETDGGEKTAAVTVTSEVTVS